MLTEKDVEWIKSNRRETTRNRTTPIKVAGVSENGKHPITGEPITEPFEEKTKARVTEITSAFKTDISLEGGILVEKGDLWVVIDLDDLPVKSSDVKTIIYDEETYTVLAADKEGLGEHNRLTIVARLDS